MGAYCYSLANNYNGALKPPVVFVEDGRAELVVRRETYVELLARELTLPMPLGRSRHRDSR